MSGKPQTIKRTRRSFGRKQFTMTIKNDRRKFLNEYRRSCNPLRACEYAQISWATFQSWLSSGFLTQEALDMAEAVFKQKHPHLDMLARHKDDDIPLGGLVLDDAQATRVHTRSPGVIIGSGVHELMRGYNEQEVMQPEGWMDVDGYGSDDL